jgi:hypothetical protein
MLKKAPMSHSVEPEVGKAEEGKPLHVFHVYVRMIGVI